MRRKRTKRNSIEGKKKEERKEGEEKGTRRTKEVLNFRISKFRSLSQLLKTPN
jgi:hypothetical protein